MNDLLDAVRRHADAQADADGIARTPIPGLTTVRATAPSGLVYAISRPLVALVVQGRKQVTQGRQVLDMAPGESLLITADGQTPHQAVITAMDAARQVGITHVSLATREPESH